MTILKFAVAAAAAITVYCLLGARPAIPEPLKAYTDPCGNLPPVYGDDC